MTDKQLPKNKPAPRKKKAAGAYGLGGAPAAPSARALAAASAVRGEPPPAAIIRKDPKPAPSVATPASRAQAALKSGAPQPGKQKLSAKAAAAKPAPPAPVPAPTRKPPGKTAAGKPKFVEPRLGRPAARKASTDAKAAKAAAAPAVDPAEAPARPGLARKARRLGEDAVNTAFRSGFVAIVGRPNVGKSTLINKLVGQKVAITSDKPQTTRHNIHGVVTTEDAQIVFVDTPGIHKPHHMLGEQLVKAASDVLGQVDLRIFLVDAQEHAGKGDAFIAELLAKNPDKPTLLVLNKCDRVKHVAERIFQSYKELGNFVGVVPLSARTGRNIQSLIEQIVERLPAGPRYYDEEVPTDQTLRVLAGELVREQILRQTSEEIPHSVAVNIETFDESVTPVKITATIYVERDSQKGIVIGDGGARLKAIGQAAREQIELQVGGQVFLELWVKVLKNWRKEKDMLKRLGYVVD